MFASTETTMRDVCVGDFVFIDSNGEGAEGYIAEVTDMHSCAGGDWYLRLLVGGRVIGAWASRCMLVKGIQVSPA